MEDRKPYLIIVDDEVNFSESLHLALEDSFAVVKAHSLSSARESLKEGMPDAVLLDLRLPDGNGIELLKELRGPVKPVVIVMTAYADVGSAISALKEGAIDYFTKPLDIERLKRELKVCLENRELQKKVIALDKEIKKNTPPFIISDTGVMKDIVKKAPMIAPLNIPILIKGGTGTGKEKLARWIHELSGNSGEMVSINCSALPKDIFESELFGYAKGAFSGAFANKEGLIEQAEGGTLFLDEIGELPEPVQAKLLRVLEDGVYYKVGETRERKVRFRLISATNKVLTEPGTNFRADLFFRINGFTFELPPLKERRDDIPLLVSAFLEEANREYHKDVKRLNDRVIEFFMKYEWPGNIRELKWVIHRAVAVSSGEELNSGEISLISEAFRNSKSTRPALGDPDSLPLQDAIEELEKGYIEKALEKTDYNKTEAAKLLNLSVRVLHYKIKQYGIPSRAPKY